MLISEGHYENRQRINKVCLAVTLRLKSAFEAHIKTLRSRMGKLKKEIEALRSWMEQPGPVTEGAVDISEADFSGPLAELEILEKILDGVDIVLQHHESLIKIAYKPLGKYRRWDGVMVDQGGNIAGTKDGHALITLNSKVWNKDNFSSEEGLKFVLHEVSHIFGTHDGLQGREKNKEITFMNAYQVQIFATRRISNSYVFEEVFNETQKEKDVKYLRSFYADYFYRDVVIQDEINGIWRAEKSETSE